MFAFICIVRLYLFPFYLMFELLVRFNFISVVCSFTVPSKTYLSFTFDVSSKYWYYIECRLERGSAHVFVYFIFPIFLSNRVRQEYF